jgi:hypothetical protein
VLFSSGVTIPSRPPRPPDTSSQASTKTQHETPTQPVCPCPVKVNSAT